MQTLLTKQGLRLDAGAVTSLNVRQPVCLQVTAGRVWVTIEGGRTDFWLTAGQSLAIPGHALVVIEAVKQASQLRVCRCRSWYHNWRALLPARLRRDSAVVERGWRTCC